MLSSWIYGWCAIKNAVAVVHSGWNEGLDQCFSSREWWVETSYVFLGQWRQFWCDWRVFRRRGCCWKWKRSFRVDLSELSVVSVRDVGQMMIRSDLLQFSRRKLTCIHDFISEGQLVRADWVAGMINLVKTVQLDVGSTTVEGETMSAYDGIGRGM